MKPVIAVTTGDPFGIGPEICLRAAASPQVREICRPLLIGDREHLLAVASRLRDRIAQPGIGGLPGGGPAAWSAGATWSLADPLAWPEVARSPFAWGSKQGEEPGIASWSEGPAIFDMADAPGRATDGPGAAAGPSAAGGRSAVMYVKQAVMLARSGRVSALVTAPISKAALHLAGHRYPGHTELLADLCGLEADEVAMLFVAPDLKVALQTVHVGLKEAIGALARDRIVARLRLVRDEHRRWFGADPRIGVCALNPHGGEGGLFGAEEAAILRPAVEEARALGIRASGPEPADTLFVRAAAGEFDLVLALYHDQGTIAVKSRSFGASVNMTLGLPFPRTSVDHGTAYGIAGTGRADAGSLVAAILLAADLGTPRR